MPINNTVCNHWSTIKNEIMQLPMLYHNISSDGLAKIIDVSYVMHEGMCSTLVVGVQCHRVGKRIKILSFELVFAC